MTKQKAASIGTWVLSVLLAIFFLRAAVPKLLGERVWTRMFAHWGYPHWFMFVVGATEVAASIALLIPRLARYAAMTLTVIMLGAAATHLRFGETHRVVENAVAITLLAIVYWRRSRPESVMAASSAA